jgi:polyisoprenoid-binding protein YceI
MKNTIILFFIALATMTYGQQVSNAKVFIDGTSNLHDWTTEATSPVVRGSFDLDATGVQKIDGLTVTFQVKNIKSTKGSTMDGNTHKALKEDKHPQITFKATDYKFDGQNITAMGTLEIAGKRNPVTIKAKAVKNSKGGFTVSGQHPLKMTDYGITPPKALMGTMKTGNDITIRFSLDIK